LTMAITPKELKQMQTEEVHCAVVQQTRPFDDLRLVGKILISPAPVYHAGAGGNRVDVTVETWLTDVYRCSEWWIELPNVED
jgi:hypothetical protein